MKILPTLAEVREIASDVNYNVLPVSCEILSDFTTPIEIIKILKNVSTHCYMLESRQAKRNRGDVIHSSALIQRWKLLA